MKFSTTTFTTLFLTTLVSLSTTEARIGHTHARAAHRRLEDEEDALGDGTTAVNIQNLHNYKGYTCGKDEATNTRVYSTAACESKACPLVLFERGSAGWYDNYDPWLKAIAATDLVVIAPTTKTLDLTCKHDLDLRKAYDWAVEIQDTLKAKIDFRHIGVAGHSAGGKHIPTFIAENKDSMKIEAALLSHGGEDVTDPAKADSMKTIPSMFTTSVGDTNSKRTPAVVKQWFDDVTTDPTNGPNVYVNLASGCHGEPHGDNIMSKPACPDKNSKTYQLSHHTGYFLACHLNGKYCDKAYNDQLCKDAAGCIYTQNWQPKADTDTDTVAAIDDTDADAATEVDVATDATTDVDADVDADAATTTDADVATDAATDVDADAAIADADAADGDVADADADVVDADADAADADAADADVADADTDADADADTYN